MDSIQSAGLICNFCDETFMKHGDLMNHKKNKHGDRVAICWNFTDGLCTFGDAGCWFLHCESEEYSDTPVWTCTLCNNEFRSQSELSRHKKQEHGHLVQECRNADNGKCIFESKACWFKHEESEKDFETEKSTNEQNIVIEKVFGMLEKMTERILQIENYNLANQSKES